MHRNVSGGARSPKSSRRRRAGLRLIALCLIVFAILLLADMRVRPMLYKAGEFHCRVIAARAVGGAVRDELDISADYGEFMRFTYDEAGTILSIESNTANINRFKARVTELINDSLYSLEQSAVDIPIGTVSGLSLLYGRGVAIPVRIAPRGAANVNLVSGFTPAGINQTLHQITLIVSVDVSAIVPGYTNHTTVETEFLVAQTVIVGRVPDSYANIVLS